MNEGQGELNLEQELSAAEEAQVNEIIAEGRLILRAIEQRVDGARALKRKMEDFVADAARQEFQQNVGNLIAGLRRGGQLIVQVGIALPPPQMEPAPDEGVREAQYDGNGVAAPAVPPVRVPVYDATGQVINHNQEDASA